MPSAAPVSCRASDSVSLPLKAPRTDSHTPASSPSRNVHGMPLACLLGHGDARLTGIAGAAPKLLAQDVCLIGVRSFEAEEAALLDRLGVRIFFMDEVQRRGLSAVFADALRHDQSNPAFDLNVRQLLHVGFKLAAKMGQRYLDALDTYRADVERNVTTNLYERHLKPLFVA